MDNINNDTSDSNLLTKSNILIIFVLFLFSSKLWDITWDILKSLLLIIVILYVLNYLNPTIGIKIKDLIMNLISIGTENKFIKDILASASKSILDVINGKENLQNKISEEKPTKFKSTALASTNGDSWVINRQLDPVSQTGNRRLM